MVLSSETESILDKKHQALCRKRDVLTAKARKDPKETAVAQ